MNLFQTIAAARELIALGKDAAELGLAIARMFRRGESPEAIAEAARQRATGLRAGQAAYEAAKRAGPGGSK